MFTQQGKDLSRPLAGCGLVQGLLMLLQVKDFNQSLIRFG